MWSVQQAAGRRQAIRYTCLLRPAALLSPSDRIAIGFARKDGEKQDPDVEGYRPIVDILEIAGDPMPDFRGRIDLAAQAVYLLKRKKKIMIKKINRKINQK
jgi:hypothetical protein